MATKSEQENELSQTNQSPQGVCVWVVPRVQLKLSRALYMHRGKKLYRDLLQNLGNATIERAMVRFRGERKKGAMDFVEWLGSLKKTRCRVPCGGSPLARA